VLVGGRGVVYTFVCAKRKYGVFICSFLHVRTWGRAALVRLAGVLACVHIMPFKISIVQDGPRRARALMRFGLSQLHMLQ
jgi:hypothetical protein